MSLVVGIRSNDLLPFGKYALMHSYLRQTEVRTKNTTK